MYMEKENTFGRKNSKTITVHYFNLQLEKALFKVEEESGFKIIRYDFYPKYGEPTTRYEIIHVYTNTIVLDQATYPERGELASNVLQWGIDKGILKEE